MAGRRRKADAALILALACGATPESAAQKAGFGLRTGYRRLAEPAFRAQGTEVRVELVRRVAGMLMAAGLGAIKTLAGAELVAAGRLDRAEDVFFLDLRDLQTPPTSTGNSLPSLRLPYRSRPSPIGRATGEASWMIEDKLQLALSSE
jgi:hypothetical protein